MTLRTTTVRRTALLVAPVLVGAAAIGSPAVAEPAPPPEGQVVLALSAVPRDQDEQSATFASPHGHATLRVTTDGRAAGQVLIHGEAVPGAAAALARGRDAVVDVSELVEAGENTVEVRLVRGDAYVSVDFPELVDVDPADLGIDPAVLARIDAAVESRLGVDEDDRYTGAVALVAHRGQVVYEKAFGDAQTHGGEEPLAEPRPTTVDTMFDMASITKVEATTAAVMRLVDEGRLDLDSRLHEHRPE